MKKRILLDLNHIEETAKVTKALSSPTRLEILRLLIDHSANISEIAKTFKLPLSSVANHINVLEDAGLILTVERPGIRGSQKVCGIAFEDVYFNAFKQDSKELDKHFVYPMDIGHYYDFEIHGACGIVSEKAYIGIEDSLSSFYSNDRVYAQLLWFTEGYIEYRFAIEKETEMDITRLRFSFELCSEAPGYNNTWPSDITVSINQNDCALIRSAGDFGGTAGALNPSWWSISRTQYGQLYHVEITEVGTYLDSVKISEFSLSDIDFSLPYISLRLGVKSDAEYVGGLNLFGSKFGNHPQGIVLEVFAKN